MLVSCLLPTYNRIPKLAHLLNEAIESFLRQTYQHKELILLNDTPGQVLRFDHPQVRVVNSTTRFATLGEKLHFMMEKAQAEFICRWDDDDISLPWRLSASVARLFGHTTCHREYFPPKNSRPALKEWRPENHWYDDRGKLLSMTRHPGNTHIMSIWHRSLIEDTGVQYPGAACPSGHEDQTFNRHIWSLGYPRFGDLLEPEDMFYLYRWGTGSRHLSGADMQANYNLLGQEFITYGEFNLTPGWLHDHIKRAADAARKLRASD